MLNQYSSAIRSPWKEDKFSAFSRFSPILASIELNTALNFRLIEAERSIIQNRYWMSKMMDTPASHRGEASQANQSSVNEAKTLHDAIQSRVRFPEDVLRVELRFGEDSTSTPAVWIILVTREDVKPLKSKILSLQQAAEEIRSVVHRESDRWPYVEISTE